MGTATATDRAKEVASVRIEIRGRNTAVTDGASGSTSRSASARSASRSPSSRELDVELLVEKNPAIADGKVAEATLHLKGITLRAREGSDRPRALGRPRAPTSSPARSSATATSAGAAASGAPETRRAAALTGLVPPADRQSARDPLLALALVSRKLIDRALRMGEAGQFKELPEARRAHQRDRARDGAARGPRAPRGGRRAARARAQRRVARRPAATRPSRSAARPAGARSACATSTSS